MIVAARRRRTRAERDKDKIAPLLARVNGQIEVCIFIYFSNMCRSECMMRVARPRPKRPCFRLRSLVNLLSELNESAPVKIKHEAIN